MASSNPPSPSLYLDTPLHEENKRESGGDGNGSSGFEGFEAFQLGEDPTVKLSSHPIPPGHMNRSVTSLRRGSVSAECMQTPSEESGLHAANAIHSSRIVMPKTDAARRRIHRAISSNLLFKNLDVEQKNDIIDAMFEKKVASGQNVITQGDPGDNFYIVDDGAFDFFVNGQHTGSVGPGSTFGELALMYNTPRAATVTATTDSSLWAVDRITFRKTINEHNYRKRRLYEGFLKSVPILATLEPSEISKIADCLEPVDFETGAVIVRQGDAADCFYMIVDGETSVTVWSSPDTEPVEVTRLKRGDYFGEMALIKAAPRAATVTALTPVRSVSLDSNAFIRLFGPLLDLLKRNMVEYEKFTATPPATAK